MKTTDIEIWIWHELIKLYSRYFLNCSNLNLDLTHHKASFGQSCYMAFNDDKFLEHVSDYIDMVMPDIDVTN